MRSIRPREIFCAPLHSPHFHIIMHPQRTDDVVTFVQDHMPFVCIHDTECQEHLKRDNIGQRRIVWAGFENCRCILRKGPLCNTVLSSIARLRELR